MPVFVRRLFATSVLALLAVCALVSAASAATRKPTVTSISPAQVPVGGVLVLKGKNFASGASHNRVFFSRATDGKSVRVRPRKATKTRIEVVVPAVVTKFLVNGQATRFQVAVFTKVLGPATKKSRSPIVLPAGSAPGGPSGPVPTTPGTAAPTTTTTTTTTPSTTTAATPPPLPDCDGDGTPDIVDGDDDNDGLSDAIEAAVHTNACNKDTDGDG